MERVNKIWRQPVWKQQMEHLAEYEKNRIFCRHGMDHLMDVARIAYIENLEKNCGISKEIIYGAALLHDIGRYLQYTEGIPHEKAGEDLAEEILKDSGFTGEEQIEILEAIARHRDKDIGEDSRLAGILYRADKKSRICGFCTAEPECNWSEEKKNRLISV